MATAAASSSSLFFLLLLFHSAASLADPATAPTPFPDEDAAAFVNSSCAATLYPRLCRASLSRYAPSIRRDPIHLAATAANVTLASIRSVSAHISAIRRSSFSAASAGPGGRRGVDARTASALRDCSEALSDAEYLTRQSAGELAELSTAEGADIAWHVGNAQTWISAALTNEETCTDGFEPGVGGAPVRADVVARVRRAKQYTSNALALVNCLVAHSP